MEIDEPRTFGNKCSEQFPITGEWQVGKVYLEKRSVARAVCWAVEDGVGVVENILRSPGLLEIALPIWYKLEAHHSGHVSNESTAQVRASAVYSRTYLHIEN